MSWKPPSLYPEEQGHVCRVCGRKLPERMDTDICQSCEDQELFIEVRDYIRSHDVREYEVAAYFGIPVSRVKRWIQEGRIQYKQEESPREVIMSNYCQICGAPTHFGTICPDCMREQQQAKKKGVAVGGVNKEERGKMRFLEGDGK